ncbi:DUF1572 domain-containing protein [Sediminibacillus dalangtanensis]|uniref:DUF1572 domain-containing protein n=1 Tax=Sediminibacillus dalangtanensis TaxID=2729421 RepID=A0ABX7VUM7_9BACI|nr:DUF1572 family protein [Sediminibacillus dalangtanensis]QTN00683.1 DUF1572 domain-containing protein [Sediminibacillus dalangtanensis]
MNLGDEYLNIIILRFKSVKRLGEQTMKQLSEKDIHWTYNSESNNVAIIVKHLSGNMVSRWTDFLNSDGEKLDRNREDEFEDTISSKAELLEIWERGWKTLFDALNSLTESDLLKTVPIRGEGLLVIDAIERQLAHYASHIGQMVYIGKLVKDSDWENLSIPRGKSQEYLQQMLDQHKKKN